jgi:hypothetical protein
LYPAAAERGVVRGGTDPSAFDESFLRFQEKIILGFSPISGKNNIRIFSDFRRKYD